MKQKILSLLLVGVLLFAGTNVVYASTVFSSFNMEEEIKFTYRYDNPVYEEIITNSSEEALSEHYMVSLLNEPTYMTDEEEIVQTLRTGMIDRVPQIHIYYATEEYSEELFSELINRWINAAIAESDDPRGGDYLRWSYRYVDIGMNGSYSSGTYYLNISFAFEFYTDNAQEEALNTEIEKVFDELKINDLTNDYLKIKTIYDYICSNISYDYEELENDDYLLKYTAYAALINKKSVCQGYATLFYTMLEQAGIDCRLISGIGNGGNHAWNIVCLDGNYYLADATWDAERTKNALAYDYFLKGEQNFDNHVAFSEYCTEEFKVLYPIALEDYIYNEEKILLGDVTGDNKINIRDVMRLKEYLSDSNSFEINFEVADMDGNGKLNIRDVMKLKELLANG